MSGSPAEIEYQGLRPGEKLHEALVHDDHDLIETGAEKVLRLNALPLVLPDFAEMIDELVEVSRSGHSSQALDIMAVLVPPAAA